MMRRFVADLHVHTVLSPCAYYQMVPALLIERAAAVGIDLLGIADHNSGENAAAVVSAAEDSGIAVLPGMEVESREGVHLLTLFDDLEALERWQEIVYAALPPRENVEKVFGAQLVVDAAGRLLGKNTRLLIAAADLSLEEVVGLSQGIGGLCVPAHVDRPANGLLPVLGLLPAGLNVPALEVSRWSTPAASIRQFPELAGRTLIRSSDAHYLEELGKATTTFLMAKASVAEISLACRQQEGRGVIG
ncbi:MAG: PHP domain-containing protein [Chloroflexota bacterium]